MDHPLDIIAAVVEQSREMEVLRRRLVSAEEGNQALQEELAQARDAEALAKASLETSYQDLEAAREGLAGAHRQLEAAREELAAARVRAEEAELIAEEALKDLRAAQKDLQGPPVDPFAAAPAYPQGGIVDLRRAARAEIPGQLRELPELPPRYRGPPGSPRKRIMDAVESIPGRAYATGGIVPRPRLVGREGPPEAVAPLPDAELEGEPWPAPAPV